MPEHRFFNPESLAPARQGPAGVPGRGAGRSFALALLAVATLFADLARADRLQYDFSGWAGPALRVFASEPPGLGADRPVVFVMHGVNRNADEYRDQWHALALEHDFLLLVPEFSQADFPGANGYNLGYRLDESGAPRPRQLWSFSAIEPIFDDARRRFGQRTDRYALYGHSAGAQFVHRFVFYVPEARVTRIVPANAGWYMMPDEAASWPYGLRDAGVSTAMLHRAFGQPVTLLLGEQDTDPRHRNLRRAPEAMAQGPHRFARGERFLELGQEHARRDGVSLNWRIVTVPGVGHSNERMAPAAVRELLR